MFKICYNRQIYFGSEFIESRFVLGQNNELNYTFFLFKTNNKTHLTWLEVLQQDSGQFQCPKPHNIIIVLFPKASFKIINPELKVRKIHIIYRVSQKK